MAVSITRNRPLSTSYPAQSCSPAFLWTLGTGAASVRVLLDGAEQEGHTWAASQVFWQMPLAEPGSHVVVLEVTDASAGVTTNTVTVTGLDMVTDRTVADVEAGTRKGYYNATDVQRVETVVSAFASLYTDLLGSSAGVTTGSFYEYSYMTPSNGDTTYLGGIRKLDTPWKALAPWRFQKNDFFRGELPAIPATLDRLLYSGANQIEDRVLEAWRGVRMLENLVAFPAEGLTWERMEAKYPTFADLEGVYFFLLEKGDAVAGIPTPLPLWDRGASYFLATGAPQAYRVEESGKYRIRAEGAAGGKGNIYSYSGGASGGMGAGLTATFWLDAGEELLFVVGTAGVGLTGTAKDGASGGGGGATFVLRTIEEITESRWQITWKGQAYEVLMVAAGGGGAWDESKKSSAGSGYAGNGANYYSPSNYTAASTLTADPATSTTTTNAMGLAQLTAYDGAGATYTRGVSKSLGGYGCGGAGDDDRTYGGGWTGASYTAYSWCLDTTATGENGVQASHGTAWIYRMEG